MNGDLPQNGFHIFQVGEFQLDTSEGTLRRGGETIAITPKMYDVLKVLVRNPGRIVDKDQLLREVWPDSFVEEGNLAVVIRHLRKAFGDDVHSPRYIQTVARRGYRLVADVTGVSDANAAERPLQSTTPYVLISISVILALSLLGLAFVWFQGERTGASGENAQRLTAVGKVTIAAVAPDGNMLVFAQKEGAGESLWMRDLTNGEQTQLLAAARVEFIGLTIPPDSSYAYYSVFTNTVSQTLSRIRLRADARPESFANIETDASVSFAPNGKQFAFTESYSAVQKTILKVADADGNNIKTLLTLKAEGRVFPVFRASPVAWSPDGELLACSVQETDGDETFFRVLLVDPQTGSERYLFEQRWGYVDHVVWKDNDTVAITNLEPNTPNRTVVVISRNTGEARKIGSNSKDYSWLSSSNGRLFAVENDAYSSIFTADFAENSNTPQTKQIFNEPGIIEDVVWARNDKLFYNSWTSGKNEIWQINPDGTEPRRITNESHLTYGFTVSPVDGTIVFAGARKGTGDLFVADANGENVRQLSDGGNDFRPRFLPDGKSVIFQRGSVIKPTLWRAWLGDIPPEPAKQLTGYFAVQPSVSPDGKLIAYQFMDFDGEDRVWRLGLMDIKTGKLINKIDFPFPVTERKSAWRSTDGRLTIVVAIGDSLGFLLLSPTDGSYETIADVTTDNISSFVWSPDGKRLAFSTNQITSDAVVLEEN